MRLFCYKARCGDSFHLKYRGISGVQRNIFLDMGHASTYDNITKTVIAQLEESNDSIDAIFLSHIHDDHVGGARRFIKAIQNGEISGSIVKRWIYNVPRNNVHIASNREPDVAVNCGITSGDAISEYITSHNPSDIMDYVSGLSFEIDGMHVTLISPDMEKLNLLRNKYKSGRPLCIHEINETSTQAGIRNDDYNTPLSGFDVNRFIEDDNIENCSSIAAIFEFNENRILWLADSVPSVTMNALLT